MTANQPEPGASPETPTKQKGRRPADTFANRLLLARVLAGHLSIREASEAAGLNREAWRDWEHGRRPRDILDACRRIADALDVDHDWLLFGGPLSPAAPPRRTSSKRPAMDTLPYPRRATRSASNTAAYPQVTERFRGSRPPGHAGARAGTSSETGQRTTHPGGSEHRRPRRLKYPSAA